MRNRENLGKRLLMPAVALLQQGLTPEKLAMCVALGVSLGIFPVIGSTCFLCALVGFVRGLNQPALQLVNFAVYPLQLMLLIPFFRFGEWLFNAPPLPLSLTGLHMLVRSGVVNAIQVLGGTTLQAIVAWGLVAPLAGVAVYFAVLPIFRRIARIKPVH